MTDSLLYLKKLLLQHEGLKLKPYKDTEGHLTIGIGRNLDAVGITEEEAEYLLDNDIKKAAEQLASIADYNKLSDVRKIVIINMTFNLGFRGVLGFVGMWQAIANKDYTKAAAEMLDSLWASQVKGRAQQLAEMMKTNDPIDLV